MATISLKVHVVTSTSHFPCAKNSMGKQLQSLSSSICWLRINTIKTALYVLPSIVHVQRTLLHVARMHILPITGNKHLFCYIFTEIFTYGANDAIYS